MKKKAICTYWQSADFHFGMGRRKKINLEFHLTYMYWVLTEGDTSTYRNFLFSVKIRQLRVDLTGCFSVTKYRAPINIHFSGFNEKSVPGSLAISIDLNATIPNQLRNQKSVCGNSHEIDSKLPYFHWKKKIAEDSYVPLSQSMLRD